MFSFLFKKENQLNNLISSYLENLAKTQEHFVKAMDTTKATAITSNAAS